MPTFSRSTIPFVALALCFAGGLAAPAFSAPPEVADARIDVKQSDNGIRYVSGGAGTEEERAIRAVAKDFSLRVVLATPSGSYLGGAMIDVRKPDGKNVLVADSQGPLFFAELPSGRYTVKASGPGGSSMSKTVNLTSGKQTEVAFHLAETAPNDHVAR